MKNVNENIRIGDNIAKRSPLLNIENPPNIFNLEKSKDIIKYWDQTPVKKAIHSSNIGLYNSLNNFNSLNRKKKKGTLLAFTNYLLRLHSRPTPFALNSIYSMENNHSPYSDENQLTIKLTASSELIKNIENICEEEENILKSLKLKVHPLHLQKKREVIFLYRQSSNKKSSISKLESNELINLIVKECQDFVPYTDVFNFIKTNYPLLEQSDFLTFIKKLLKNDFLISSCRISLVEASPVSKILQILEAIPQRSAVVVNLISEIKTINTFITNIDYNDYFDIFNRFESISTVFNVIPNPSFQKWFNTVLIQGTYVPETSRVVNVINIVDEYMDLFSNWNPHTLIPKNLTNLFIEQFGSNIVSLKDLVYDSNFYEALAEDSVSDLLNHNYEILKAKIIETIMNKKKILNIDDSFVKKLKQPDSYDGFIKPNGYELICYLTEEHCILEKGFGSNSLGKLNGRFLQNLSAEKKESYQKELSILLNDHVNDDYIFAEVTCSPYDTKMGNILSGLSSFKFEIPLNTNVSSDKQSLSLEDLYVGVENDSFYLWSISLNKRIIPYQSNAAALNSKLPRLYSFLVKLGLENQSLISDISILPDTDLPYLPEIRYKNIIIRRAEWKFDDFFIVSANNKEEALKEHFLNWRRRYSVPQIVGMSTGDAPTAYNLDNKLHIEVLLKEFRNNIESLEDYSFIDLSYQIQPGGFSQYIVGVGNKKFSVPKINNIVYRREQKNSDKLSLKDNWIYIKIYPNRFYSMDNLHFIKNAIKSNTVEFQNWFFVRYKDTKDHIRLRIQTRNSTDTFMALSHITRYLDNLIEDNSVDKYNLDLFEPEYTRYGGKNKFPTIIKWFEEDSEWFFKKEQENIVAETVYSTYLILRFLGFENIDISELFDSHSLNTKKKFREYRSLLYSYCESTESTENMNTVETILNDIRKNLLSMHKQESKEIVLSLLHMHINRHVGIDRQQEFEIYGLVSNLALSLNYLKGGTSQ